MLAYIGILTVILFVGIIILSRYRVNPVLAWILAISFCVRLFAAVFQELYQLVPYAWDEASFMNMGIKVMNYYNGSRSTIPSLTLSGVNAYGTLLGGLFLLYDANTFLARLLSVTFGTGVVYLVWKIGELVGLKRTARVWCSLLVGFTPSYIVYSTLIMRDALIWYLIMFFMYLWVRAIQELKLKYLIWGLIPVILLFSLRPQYAPIFVLSFAFICFVFTKRTQFQFKEIILPGVQFLILLIGFGLVTFSTVFLVLSEISRWDNVTVMEYLISQQGWRAQGGAAYLVDVEYKSIEDVLKYLPLRFIHFTFGPFLWNSSSIQVFASAVESLVGWIFFILLVLYWRKSRWLSDKMSDWYAILLMLIFLLLNLFAASIIDSNYGTAMRHRMVFMPLLFISVMWMRQQFLFNQFDR